MPFDQIREQQETARHLPPPLYVLYMQTSAYRQACGKLPPRESKSLVFFLLNNRNFPPSGGSIIFLRHRLFVAMFRCRFKTWDDLSSLSILNFHFSNTGSWFYLFPQWEGIKKCWRFFCLKMHYVRISW